MKKFLLGILVGFLGLGFSTQAVVFDPVERPELAETLDNFAEDVLMKSNTVQQNYLEAINRVQVRYSDNEFVFTALEYLREQIVMGMPEMTIVDVAVESGDFPTLVSALQAANLVEALEAEGPFTVFAPTEQAFADLLNQLGITAQDLLADTDLLTTVLTYHVVEGNISSSDVIALTHGTRVETLQGEDIIVDNRNEVAVNDSEVVAADITASNGVIHVIDEVLLPPTVRESLGLDNDQPDEDIVEVAVNSGSFPTLVAAVQAVGLVETLQEEGPYTVYAPTEEAFADLLDQLDVTAEELLADTDLLTDVLLYHVVPGRYDAEDILALDSEVMSPTALGIPLTIDPNNGSPMINMANVVQTDIYASNGVIHVIDQVLLPDQS